MHLKFLIFILYWSIINTVCFSYKAMRFSNTHTHTLFFNYFPFCLLQHIAAVKSLQLCPTLCDAMDSSPPGSPDHGILQARTHIE